MSPGSMRSWARDTATPSTSFWLFGEEKHPVLSVLVRGNLACVHFFPREGHPGFASVGNESADASITFRGSTEAVEVSGACVVTFEQARQAAREFLLSRSLPASLRWSEL
jgi:Immunity protein Imm1